jgi:hypothetical protein
MVIGSLGIWVVSAAHIPLILTNQLYGKKTFQENR